ncbi:HAMP domain-containing sensor histidine kinase [Niveispirillum sp. BGYR6]|uniref:sensor histidine kinase n=1 Tax=Niveispirillum sp. BGYR6 TaxID=2971249 RepID=UPI0022B96C1A|nr:HAMP domain-containing sensor histidine kinase [Niveispirillum sp. BGYR6]MDG5494732.1 HAMP domain-containing sensor histidine kinase [Niveispirillum sp. BGYR6]
MVRLGLQGRLAAALRRVTDLFIPTPMRQPGFDENQLQRARAFVRITLLILGGLLVISGVWIIKEGPSTPASLAWMIYATLLAANLVLVRLTGRFHAVTLANNLMGLTAIAYLLNLTGGLHSPLLPLFLVGVVTTGNFGGNRAILMFFGGFALVIIGTYLCQLYRPPIPLDLHSRFALMVTAIVLMILATLSAQSARTRTRRRLRDARDAAVAERRTAEKALADLRAAQSQMLLQEKMAGLGSMVAGVAHEVNTPVGLTVTGASQLRTETRELVARVAEGKLRRHELDDYLRLVEELSTLIERNALRAGELIQSFKDVAVDQSSDARRAFRLGPYSAEVLASLSPHLRRAQHKVAVDIPEAIELDGYPGAVAQVITNLVMNSIMHGYPDERPGHLRLSARLLPGDRVELVYSDDGQGIPPSLWERIFEPFFTTRRGSGGSGLGLYLLYSIVTVRLGGTVTVGDAPEGGALFTLVFPRRAPEKVAAETLLGKRD